ncbi:glycosyltransferase family protein [Rhodovulum viride]|uniref:glycosyltransferase family protein n=1 Tax=Rhodovulum viride TaxID=1231134 RepID=UPI0011BF23F1|nr:glycosyltransferase family 4 protein [Rhodovulum viride]
MSLRPLGVAPPAFLAGRFSPTADLYLGFACRDRLARGALRQLSPTVFAAGETLIVIRHAAGMRTLPPHRRLVYVIDDDIRAGIADRALPPIYRAKLALLEWPEARRFEPAAAAILATSSALAATLRARRPGARVEEIAPAWPVAQMPVPDPVAPIRRIGLLMGRSHARDAAPLWAPLLRVLDRRPGLALTVSGNLDLPRAVARHPAVDVLPALDWAAYLGWLRQARLDLGLVPHLASRRFNAARSASKLGEYAMAGAAVIGSDSWHEAARGAMCGRCLALGADPAAWIAAIDRLIDDPASARAMAAKNREALIAADAEGHQRRLWASLLDAAED